MDPLREYNINQKGTDKLYPIEYLTIPQNFTWQGYLEENRVVFVLSGCLYLSINHISEITSENEIILMPKSYHYLLHVEGDVTVVVFCIDTICLAQFFPRKKQRKFDFNNSEKIPVLYFHENLFTFATHLINELKSNNQNAYYLELKTKELFFLFRQYYKENEVNDFFCLLLDAEYEFISFVYNNYQKVRNVSEFAKLYNSSTSLFRKKFRKVFNAPPYQWMMEKKKQFILNDLKNTTKIYKQIAAELGFVSVSQFTDYCKTHLGASPGKIRSNSKVLNKE